MITKEAIVSAVKDCLIKAGTTFRNDQLAAYKTALQKEKNENAKWVLEKLFENAKIAQKKMFPLCDDSGIPHAIAEIGDDAELPAGWLSGIYEGIAEGLRRMPGRPMAVKGNDMERIEQSRGLYKDPAKLSPAPVIVRPIPGNTLRVTILMLGGGPEIRARTYRIFHKRSMEKVLREASDWMASEVKDLGCTPCTLAIGIGRTHMEASTLMLEAMKKGSLKRQNQWEEKVTAWINAENVGPLGLGGTLPYSGRLLTWDPPVQAASGS